MINKIQKSKLFVVLFCAATFLSSVVVLHDLTKVVIVNDLYNAFPNETATVTLIVSLPAIVNIFACLLAGYLLKYMSTKTQLLISNALMCICGIFGCAIPSPGFIVFTSIMLGIAAGFANTAGCTILCEVFQDEEKRSRMMGYYNSAASLMGVYLTFGAGVLAVQGWPNVFNIWWIGVPTLILGIFFLPNIKPSQRVEEQPVDKETPSANVSGGIKAFPRRFWTFVLTLLLFYFAYNPFMTYASLYVAEHNLGGSVYIGLYTSMTTLSATLIGLVYGSIFVKLRRRYNYIILTIPIICILLLMWFPGKILALVCAFMMGIAYGSWYGGGFAYAACCLPLAMQGMGISIIAATNNLGFGVGNWLVPKMMEWMNTGGLITPVFKVSAVIWIIALIFEHFNIRRDVKERFMMDTPQGG